MSAFKYFKELGYQQRSPINRTISNASTASNIVIWTPSASMRVMVTNLTISAAAQSGTIAFFFGGNNSNQKLAEFSLAGSSTIVPSISAWESTATDAPLYVNVSTGTTNQWSLTAEGFEGE